MNICSISSCAPSMNGIAQAMQSISGALRQLSAAAGAQGAQGHERACTSGMDAPRGQAASGRDSSATRKKIVSTLAEIIQLLKQLLPKQGGASSPRSSGDGSAAGSSQGREGSGGGNSASNGQGRGEPTGVVGGGAGEQTSDAGGPQHLDATQPVLSRLQDVIDEFADELIRQLTGQLSKNAKGATGAKGWEGAAQGGVSGAAAGAGGAGPALHASEPQSGTGSESKGKESVEALLAKVVDLVSQLAAYLQGAGMLGGAGGQKGSGNAAAANANEFAALSRQTSDGRMSA
jgi:hypothetical protein